MTLRKFVELPDVRARLADIMPARPERAPSVPPRVVRSSTDPRVMGTAFDYAVRFEILGRRPGCRAGRWVAEDAADIVAHLHGQRGRVAARVVSEAREFLRRPFEQDRQRERARHAFRLAKLDPFFRNPLGVDPKHLDDLEAVSDVQVDEIVALLDLVPIDTLCRPKRIALNPNFDRYSTLVDGADADIITGDLLVDLKTTSQPTIELSMVRQVLGYLILARRACRRDGSLPKPRRIAIYFSRFGWLWSPPVRINELPAYRETADWFIRRARQHYPGGRAHRRNVVQGGTARGFTLREDRGASKSRTSRGNPKLAT